MENETYQLLDRILDGDRNAREILIERYRSSIYKTACRVCRRRLEWGKDEELSIALIAFNEALDAYTDRKDGNLDALAKVVVQRRLIDYFRQNKRRAETTSLSEEVSVEEDWEQREREEEVKQYSQLLKQFQLDFFTVADASPKHLKTRMELQKAAVILAERKELMEYLHSSHKLPRQELCRLAGITPRVLERGRTYIIALSLLLAEDNFPYLQESLGVITGKAVTHE